MSRRILNPSSDLALGDRATRLPETVGRGILPFPLVTNDDARVKRLYALAEALGRLSGEAHNLVSDLAAKMAAGRAATRSTSPATPRRRPRAKKS